MIPRVRTKSLFEEYYYGFLAAFTLGVMVLLKAGGLNSSDALVIGLWIGAIGFFVTQLVRYLRYKIRPGAAAETGDAQASVAKPQPQLVPEKALPSVKDAPSIKLVPKPGQSPRPAIITGTAKPSPFIKPPK
jgi:hypothetical protein